MLRRTRPKVSRSLLTQHLNLNGRAKLLKSRDLFYDVTVFLANSSDSGVAGSQTNAFVSNGLTFDQKFGGIYTFNARAAREDNYQPAGHVVDYQYSAAISATPYATLNDSLLYSGHYNINPPGTTTAGGGTSSATTGTTTMQNSIFMYNTATLYPGINGLLNGGVTFATLETGQSDRTLQANAGFTLVPNSRVNLNLNYNITNSVPVGGGQAGARVNQL